MKGVRNTEYVATCEASGRPVREKRSHVMLVPVGRGRMYFHAGCWRVKAVRGMAADNSKVRVRRVVGFRIAKVRRRQSFGLNSVLGGE